MQTRQRHSEGAFAAVDAVDALFVELRSAGVKLLKAPQRAFRCGYSGHFADLDEFLRGVAWNPQFPHA